MTRFFLFLIFGCTLVLSGTARAEVSIAVVDVQELLTKSTAAKSIQKQSQKYRDAFLDQLSKQEEELRNSEKELMEEGKSLSKEEFMERKKAFETKFIETQNLAKKRKKEIDQAYSKAMSELMDKIYEIVQDVANDRGYGLVLSKQNVIIGEHSLDISEESLKRLNDSVKKIKLDISDK